MKDVIYLLPLLGLGILGLVIYFIPTIIVIVQKRPYPVPVNVFILNLCLGWSGIVWMFLTFFYLSSYAGFKNEQAKNY